MDRLLHEEQSVLEVIDGAVGEDDAEPELGEAGTGRGVVAGGARAERGVDGASGSGGESGCWVGDGGDSSLPNSEGWARALAGEWESVDEGAGEVKNWVVAHGYEGRGGKEERRRPFRVRESESEGQRKNTTSSHNGNWRKRRVWLGLFMLIVAWQCRINPFC